MKRNIKRVAALMALCLAFVSVGAAAEEIEASGLTNPAPSQAFTAFDRIEVRPITMGEPYAGQKANDAALVSLQANLDQRLQAWLPERNQRAVQGAPRVLLVEPRVDKIRFIGGGARFWAGAMAGSSRVLMKARITDQATGALIAEPEFYQHAAGMAGAWSMGGADKAMLARTTTLLSDYLKANDPAAVGGPTGQVVD